MVRTLLASAVGGVDPEPSTDASTRGARRHSRRDLEVGKAMPHTGVVHAEHSKIFWLDLPYIRLVRNSKATACDIVDTSCMIDLWRGSRTRVVAITNVPTI